MRRRLKHVIKIDIETCDRCALMQGVAREEGLKEWGIGSIKALFS